LHENSTRGGGVLVFVFSCSGISFVIGRGGVLAPRGKGVIWWSLSSFVCDGDGGIHASSRSGWVCESCGVVCVTIVGLPATVACSSASNGDGGVGSVDLLALLVHGGLSSSHPDRTVVGRHGSERHGGLLIQCW